MSVQSRRAFWRDQAPMLFWSAALFVQSSIPSGELPKWEILTHDKALHFLIYVVFAYTVYRALTRQERFPSLRQRAYLASILFVAFYAATDEWHQSFVPGRECSLLDWIADSVGACVFASSHWVYTKLKVIAPAK